MEILIRSVASLYVLGSLIEAGIFINYIKNPKKYKLATDRMRISIEGAYPSKPPIQGTHQANFSVYSRWTDDPALPEKEPQAMTTPELHNRCGARFRCRGTVMRFGTDSYYRSTWTTVLLSDIIACDNGKLLSEEQEFKAGKWATGLTVGAIVEFEARAVEEYEGGDLKLKHPTSVVIVQHGRDRHAENSDALAALMNVLKSIPLSCQGRFTPNWLHDVTALRGFSESSLQAVAFELEEGRNDGRIPFLPSKFGIIGLLGKAERAGQALNAIMARHITPNAPQEQDRS